MEYDRSPAGQIQADFAYRVGIIASQYQERAHEIPEDRNFDSTLNVCLLQNLVTQCGELADYLRRTDRGLGFLGDAIPERGGIWDIDRDCIIANSKNEGRTPTYGELLRYIRNALSHPVPIDPGSLNVPTGYDYIAEDGKIKSYVFVAGEHGRNRGTIAIVLSSAALLSIVLGLSTVLAQPKQPDWDGEFITDLGEIAA